MKTQLLFKFLCTSMLVFLFSACGSIATPTPTPHPIADLREGYVVAQALANTTIGQAKNAYALPQEAVSNYDTLSGTPKWVNAVFIFVTYDGSKYGMVSVGVDPSGTTTLNRQSGQPPYPNSIDFYLQGSESSILSYAWTKLGAEMNSKCGPVTTESYDLKGISSILSAGTAQPLYKITYNNTIAITLLGDNLEIQQEDPPCPEGTASTSQPAGATQATQVPATDTPTLPGEYTVKAGDSCASISAILGISRQKLIEVNHLASDCNDIQAGQILTIPVP